jgi:hypothetical protein
MRRRAHTCRSPARSGVARLDAASARAQRSTRRGRGASTAPANGEPRSHTSLGATTPVKATRPGGPAPWVGSPAGVADVGGRPRVPFFRDTRPVRTTEDPERLGSSPRGLGCPRRAQERRGRTREAPGSAGDDSIRPVVRTLRVGRRNQWPRRSPASRVAKVASRAAKVSGRVAKVASRAFQPMTVLVRGVLPSPDSPGAVLGQGRNSGRMVWTWQDARTRTRTRKRKRTAGTRVPPPRPC